MDILCENLDMKKVTNDFFIMANNKIERQVNTVMKENLSLIHI